MRDTTLFGIVLDTLIHPPTGCSKREVDDDEVVELPSYTELEELFPELAEVRVPLDRVPAAMGGRDFYSYDPPLVELIWRLNDHGGWSTDEIAAYVEGFGY